MASANEVLSVPMFVGEDGDPYDNADNISPMTQSQPVYDFLPDTPRCKCCPYGFHVDVGFVKYAEDAKRGKYLRHLQQIQKYKNRLRQTMEAFYKQHGRYPHLMNPPDLIRGSESDTESVSRLPSGPTIEEHADADTFALFGTTERHSKVKTDRPRTPTARAGLLDMRAALEYVGGSHSSSSSGKEAGMRLAVTSPDHCQACHRQASVCRLHSCPQCRPEASCDLCSGYASCPQCSPVHSMALVEREDSGAVQITKEQLTGIREQMARSLARLRELEEKAKEVPVLQTRIKLLHEEKRLLEMQVQEKQREKDEMGLLYETTLKNVTEMESRWREEEAFLAERRIAVEESHAAMAHQDNYSMPGSELRDKAVGDGDVRHLYYLQDSDQQLSDYEFDLPAGLLEILHSRWEASYKRDLAAEVAMRREVGTVAVPLVHDVSVGAAQSRSVTADVGQFVDMDDEEWSMQEANFTESGPSLTWYQEQIASAREQRSVIRTLRSAYQFNSVEFKNMIIKLLAKNVRSQAVQVRPENSDFGLVTEFVSKRSVGVSEDSVDVVVRPFVQLYSIGTEVRPLTSNKMVFTDRTFRYDAGTNTARTEAQSIGVSTDAEHHVFFTLGTQTEAARVRSQGMFTDPVLIVDRTRMLSAGTNTEGLVQHSVGVTASSTRHRVDRAMATETVNLYEAGVSTDQVLTLDKNVNTTATEVRRRISVEEPEVVMSESWEEYSVRDGQGQVVHQEVTPVSRSRTTIVHESAGQQQQQQQRSSSVGATHRGGAEYSVMKSGSYEFGGGTVRSGQAVRSGAAESTSSSSSSTVSTSFSKRRHVSEQGASEAVEMAYARSRMPLSSAEPRPLPPDPSRDFFADLIGPSSASEMATLRGSKIDVKVTDFYTSCMTLARWTNDSTTTTSKQMNEAEANIRQAWFRLAGSRASRPEVVEPYLSAIRELGSAVIERVVNLADNNGNTCIHYAISQANWPMVSLLLRTCPVHLDRLNRTGYSALMLAALCDLPSQQYPTLAVDLARAANNVDLASSSGAGQTALMLAASHGRTAMVEALLASGADPNIKDKEGSTALMCASEHGHLEVVRALLARPNTDATATDGEGSTALSIAMENNHRDIALLIYARTNLGKPSVVPPSVIAKSQQGKIAAGATYRSRKTTRSVFEKFMPIRRIKEEDF